MHTATLGTAVPRERSDFAYRGWSLVSPKMALASFVPFVVGIAIARGQGRPLDAFIAAGAFAAIFLAEVARNAINVWIDRRSGAYVAIGGEPVVGNRILVIIASIAMIAAGVIGTLVAESTRPELLMLGAAAALIAVVYSVPPVKLSYRGLGEGAGFLTYGPGIVIGSVLLFGGRITLDVITIAISLGLLIANAVLVDEVRRQHADEAAGKRTLVVRLGRERATSMFGFVFAAAFALPFVTVLLGGSIAMLGLLAGVIPADYATWSLHSEKVRPPAAAQTSAVIAYVAAGLGTVALGLAMM